ncbi:MAG: PAS domain-containing protein [Burkholderiales bacterium]
MSPGTDPLLDAVLDSIAELAVLVDPQGRIVAFNRACEALTGYRHDEVRGKALVETLVPGEWGDRVRQRFADPHAPEAREPHENPWRTRSGEYRLIRWRCTPVALPGAQAPHVLELGTEMPEQAQLEARLRAQSRLLETFFESTLACAAVLDRHFNFLRVNRAYAQACARPVPEFAGRNHFELFPSDAQAIFEEVVRSRIPYFTRARPFEFPDHPEWGVTHWDWTLVPVLDDDGGVEYLILCLHDVTAHHRSEDRLLRALAQLESQSRQLERVREAERRRLAMELHDEMGQELTALKLSLEGLRLTGSGDASALKRPIAIIGRLQERIRGISSHLRPPMLEEMGLAVALAWLFQKLRADLDLEISFRHAGLEARLPEEVETAVYRIVQEALTNVAKHAGVRAARVLLRAAARSVVLKVEDDGCGFEPDLLGNSREGTGLVGMKVRVRRLGGRLAIESAPGQGATLTADLPLGEAGPTP